VEKLIPPFPRFKRVKMNKDNDFYSKEQNESFAETWFKYFDSIFQFADKHKTSIMAVQAREAFLHRDNCIKLLWFRIFSWLKSVKALNSSVHFQALGAANRALFELTVDIALLYLDKTTTSGWKMYYWSLSEKLDGSEKLINFFDGDINKLPDEYIAYKEYFLNEEHSVKLMRKSLGWTTQKKPDGFHPKHWSGKNSFFDNLPEIDRNLHTEINKLFGKSLLEYYRTEYKKMSWQLHSGVNNSWKIPEEAFPVFTAFFLKDCANFGLLATHLVLKDFMLADHLPNYIDELKDIDEQNQIRLIQFSKQLD
jgi:hypothetical protein